MNGIFITFEGPDGAGKTTQIRMLAHALQEAGHHVVMTREPGGTRIGDQIRALLLAPEHTEMDNRTEALLYAAQRAQHVQERILPELRSGKIVLCDRFIDASIAYQAAGLGIDEQFVRAASDFAAGGLRPHRTYMLDLPAEESLRRLAGRAAASGAAADLDRIEQRPLDYHRRVRDAFLHIAGSEPDRVMLLDAMQTPEMIFQVIRNDCKRFLS